MKNLSDDDEITNTLCQMGIYSACADVGKKNSDIGK